MYRLFAAKINKIFSFVPKDMWYNQEIMNDILKGRPCFEYPAWKKEG
jgi:hypothetical protein